MRTLQPMRRRQGGPEQAAGGAIGTAYRAKPLRFEGTKLARNPGNSMAARRKRSHDARKQAPVRVLLTQSREKVDSPLSRALQRRPPRPGAGASEKQRIGQQQRDADVDRGIGDVEHKEIAPEGMEIEEIDDL